MKKLIAFALLILNINSANAQSISSVSGGSLWFMHPPTPALFSFTANGTGVTQSSSYDAVRGYSFSKTDAGTASAERAAFVGKAVPASTPWTVTSKLIINASGTTGAPAQHVSVGLAIYNSISNKIIVFGQQNVGGVVRTGATYFSDLNTFASDIVNVTLSAQLMPTWFRVSYDGTTYTFSISYDDGITWTTSGTALSSSFFVADKVGISIETFSTVSLKPTALVQYYSDPDFP